MGGTGETGSQLLRLRSANPAVEVVAVTSRSDAGTPLATMVPRRLRSAWDLTFSDPAAAGREILGQVYFVTPNGTAMQQAQALLAARVRVLDLTKDFRLPRGAGPGACGTGPYDSGGGSGGARDYCDQLELGRATGTARA